MARERTPIGHDISDRQCWGWEWNAGDTTYSMFVAKKVAAVPTLTERRNGAAQPIVRPMGITWCTDGTYDGFMHKVAHRTFGADERR